MIISDIRPNTKFKHEELYSAPLCKLYAFEARRSLCSNSPTTGWTGDGSEPGDIGGNNDDGDDLN